MMRPPPRSTLFPDTALFRSRERICYFEIVDRSRDGHIVVDEIVFSPHKDQPPTTDNGADPSPQVTTDLKHLDRKSTRLNSSHANISYAVFCLKKKTTQLPSL